MVINMKTCPNCKELLGETVDRCFKCGYSFAPSNPGKTSQPANRICPKCKRVYYSVPYTNCPNCHVPMPLFSEQAKALAEAEKRRFKVIDIISSFGLNHLDPTDISSIDRISNELVENGFFEAVSHFSSAKFEDRVMLSCLHALVEQNWIIIRQLNTLNKRMERLCSAPEEKQNEG